MPSGKTHDKINDVLLVAGLAGFLSFFSFFIYGWLGALMGISSVWGYQFGTRMNGPDLDVKSKLYYRWKKMKWIWIPYQKMFSHRSVFTHGIVIGDVIRYLYLAVVGGFLFLFVEFIFEKIGFIQWIQQIETFQSVYQFIQTLFSQYQSFILFSFVAFFIGNVLASTIHIVTDHTVSTFKKMKKKRK